MKRLSARIFAAALFSVASAAPTLAQEQSRVCAPWETWVALNTLRAEAEDLVIALTAKVRELERKLAEGFQCTRRDVRKTDQALGAETLTLSHWRTR